MFFNKKEDKEHHNLGKGFLLYLLTFIPMYFWAGFILMRLWNWFVIEIGVRRIGIAEAVGLTVILTFVKARKGDVDNPDILVHTIESITFNFLLGIAILFEGFLLHWILF